MHVNSTGSERTSLLQDDGTLVLLDFGQCKALSATRQRALAKLIIALDKGWPSGIVAALKVCHMSATHQPCILRTCQPCSRIVNPVPLSGHGIGLQGQGRRDGRPPAGDRCGLHHLRRQVNSDITVSACPPATCDPRDAMERMLQAAAGGGDLPAG